MTVIPYTYISSINPFTLYLDQVHMPYSYDLTSYYIFTINALSEEMSSSNSFVMTNADVFYTSPLKSLLINCQDNAIGVVNTYCTIIFGTQNPLLANGKIRLALSGMTVATDTCELSLSNGTSIATTCSSTEDNQNLTVAMEGFEFYTAGNFTLVIYCVGITADTLSQSINLELYDNS